MAAIFQIRRGTTNVSLAEGELYLHQGSGSLQIGSGSANYNVLTLDAPVEGNINLIGEITASHMFVSGNLNVSGNLFLGNQTSDTITATGEFTSDLIPNPTNTYSIGSTSKVWKNVYATSFTGSLNGDVNGINITTFSSSVDNRLDQLESDSGSQNTRITTLEDKADTLETYTASVDDRLDQLQLASASLQSFTSSQEAKDIIIGNYTSSMNIFTSSQEAKDVIIGAYTASMNLFTASTDISLNEIELYTASLKTAIDVTGGDTRIKGNLIVDGTQTSLNTTNVYIEDYKITVASGSSNSAAADGAGFEVAGANVSMSWEDSNNRFGINTNLGILGSISSSTIVGLNGASVTEYSWSVDDRLKHLQIESASFNGHISDINIKTGSFENKFAIISEITASYNSATASLNTFTQSVNGHILDLNSWTSSQNEKDTIISNITASYNGFTGSVTASLVELFSTASNHEIRIDDLESKATTLETYTSSIDNKFTIIESITASYNVHTSSLNQFTASTYSNFSTSVDSRLDELEYTTSINLGSGAQLAFSQLEAFTASAAIRLNNLESTSASINVWSSSISTTYEERASATHTLVSSSAQIVGVLDSLNSFTSSQESKNLTLESYTSSVNTSLSGLNTYTASIREAIQITGSNTVFLGSITVYGTQSVINSENLSVNDNIIYLSPTASTDNDLGIVGHYNDGTYRHAGIFMDASDGHTWKVFNGLQDETTGSVNTSGTGFTLAPFKAGAITATSFDGIINATNGVISSSAQITSVFEEKASATHTLFSGSSQVNADSITNFDANVLAYNNSLGVVSGSSQITLSSTTGGSTTSDVQFGSLGIGTAASGVSGEIRATGDITAYYSSDERLKENIQPIQNALSKVEAISGNTYDWKEGFENIHSHIGNDLGVIAQEVQSILPEIVTERETGYLAVDYIKLVPVLIEAIKELSAKVKDLENK